ncbi:MAG: hypothetical protein DRJ64_00765 [Thermoprotei archaeon]|nr:MAG: hypothetical protein DRJ64_00765 [Thermoprotei archaeon]
MYRRRYLVYRHPASLNPIIASSSILLTVKGENSIIYDPFTGSATILIEAKKISRTFRCIGSDICREFVKGALRNARYAGVDIDLFISDFSKNPLLHCDYVITDPPRGKRVKVRDNIEKLYKKFFSSMYNIASKIVLITPYLKLTELTCKGYSIEKF